MPMKEEDSLFLTVALLWLNVMVEMTNHVGKDQRTCFAKIKEHAFSVIVDSTKEPVNLKDVNVYDILIHHEHQML